MVKLLTVSILFCSFLFFGHAQNTYTDYLVDKEIFDQYPKCGNEGAFPIDIIDTIHSKSQSPFHFIADEHFPIMVIYHSWVQPNGNASYSFDFENRKGTISHIFNKQELKIADHLRMNRGELLSGFVFNYIEDSLIYIEQITPIQLVSCENYCKAIPNCKPLHRKLLYPNRQSWKFGCFCDDKIIWGKVVIYAETGEPLFFELYENGEYFGEEEIEE